MTFKHLLRQKLRRTPRRQLKVIVTIYNFVMTFIINGRSRKLSQQPDKNVEDTNREDIVTTNFILSGQIFQRSTVNVKRKLLRQILKTKAQKSCHDKFKFIAIVATNMSEVNLLRTARIFMTFEHIVATTYLVGLH